LFNRPDQEAKTMNLRKTLTATVLSLLAVGAFAQAASTPGVDARQARQNARIQQGVNSGALTPAETKRMEAREAHVGNVEDRAKADGTVTQAEKANITRAQDKASRKIRRQKHDAQITAPASK
jgi:hypothetical protein